MNKIYTLDTYYPRKSDKNFAIDTNKFVKKPPKSTPFKTATARNQGLGRDGLAEGDFYQKNPFRKFSIGKGWKWTEIRTRPGNKVNCAGYECRLDDRDKHRWTLQGKEPGPVQVPKKKVQGKV